MPVEIEVEAKTRPSTALKLNLGCGQNRLDGFTGVDYVKTATTDVVMDLEVRPWPWDTSSVDAAICNHTLEHLNDPIGFMDELHRVLKPDAKVVIAVPHAQTSGAWQDPTHKRPINEKFFLYFSKKFREQDAMKADHYPIRSDFEIEGDSVLYTLEDDWKDKTKKEIDFAIKHFNNVVTQFCVVLICRK